VADYNANIKVNVQASSAEKALDKVSRKVSELSSAASSISFKDIVSQASLNKTLLTIRNLNEAVATLKANLRRIDAPGRGKFGDQIRVAATQADKFFDGLTTKGTTALAKSTQGLREQAAAFQFLSANIDAGSARYQDYVQGAQAAQDKLLTSTFKTFEALRKLYGENITGRGVDIEGGKLGAGFFEKLGKDVPRTTSAVKAYYEELVRIRGLVEPSSLAGLGIEQEIIRITNLLRDLEAERKAVERLARGPQVAIAERVRRNVQLSERARTDSGFKAFSIEAGEQTAIDKSIRRQEEKLIAASKRVRQQIQNDLQADPPQLALPAFEERGLKELSKGYLEVLDTTKKQRQELETTRNVVNSLPEGLQRGTRFYQKLEEQTRRLAEYTGTNFTLTGETNKRLRDNSSVSESWATALRVGNGWLQQDVQVLSSISNITRQTLSSTNAQVEAKKRLVKIQSFEKAQAERIKAIRQRTESLSLGVGFPLAFGAGPGATLGSFIGSFAGKTGFGGQILGTALGQSLEDIARKAAQTTKDVQTLSDAAGILGTVAERNIKALQEAGREQEAYEEATKALAKAVGERGVTSLRNFNDVSNELSNALQQLSSEFSVFISDILGGVIGTLAQATAERNLFVRAQRSSDPQQRENFQQLSRSFGGNYDEVRNRILARQREIEAAAEKELKITKEIKDNRLQQERVLEAEINLAQTSGEITDDKVFALEKILVQKRFEADLQSAINAGESASLANLNKKLSLLELDRKREEAFNKAREKAARDTERAAKEAEQNRNTALDLYDTLFEQVTLLEARNKYDKENRTVNLDTARVFKEISELKDSTYNKDIEALALRNQELRSIKLINDELYERVRLSRDAGDAAAARVSRVDGLPFITDQSITEGENIDKLQRELDELISKQNLAAFAAKTFADNFTQGIGQAVTAAITGTETIGEAFSAMFEKIGAAFIDLGAQILSQQLVLTVLRAVSTGFSFSGAGPAALPGGEGFAQGFSLPALFAEGGYVTKPTNAIIGEGGEPEYVIPFSKMGSAAANFADGARGEDVFGPLRSTSVPFSKTTERLMSERSERETISAINSPQPLDVRFESQVINGVEYVTAEQHKRGMQQAAESGRTLALSALQNSVRTRRKVGIA
jgi:hypothetical protein